MEAWARPRWEAAQWQPHEGPGARLTRPRQVRELLTEKLLEHHPQQRLRRPRLPDGKTCAAVGQPLLGRPHVLSHRHHADAHTITSLERPSLPLPPQPGAALRCWLCQAGYLGPGLGGCGEAWAQPCPLALQGPSVGPRGLRPPPPRTLGTYWEGGWGVGGGGCSLLLLWRRSQRSVTWGSLGLP